MSKLVRWFLKFYQFYKDQHKDPRCRWMHFHGINAGILVGVAFVQLGYGWWALAPAILTGYAISIPSHKQYEGNNPASLTRPLWLSIPCSFLCDWLMWFEIWMGRLTTTNPYRRA